MAQSTELSLVLVPSYPVAEADKLTWLRNGRLIRYPGEPPTGFDTAAWNSIRTVRAEMLLSLFDKKTKSCSVPIRLRHVIVEGDLRLGYAVCPFEFSVSEASTFTSEIDFSYAKLNGVLDFSTSTFEKRLRMDFAKCNYDLRLEGTYFLGEASFAGISVSGRLNGRGSQFKSYASFAGMHCTKLVSFKSQIKDNAEKVTIFGGDALFYDTKFDGTAEFDGVQFKGELNFNRSSVAGNLLFRPAQLMDSYNKLPTRFKGPVSFTDSVIGGNAVFEASESEKEFSYRRAQLGGGLYFREALFGPKAKAIFDNLQSGGPIMFDGAQFAAGASFEAAQIKGSASFRSIIDKVFPTRFGRTSLLRDAVIAGNANFGGAEFWSVAGQPEQVAADFSRTRIGGSAFFMAVGKPAQSILHTTFNGRAVFDDISIQGICVFSGTRFLDAINFRRAQVGSSMFFGAIEIGEEVAKTRFDGLSNFSEGRFRGSLDFSGVHFKGRTIWDRSIVEGAVIFRPFSSERTPLPIRVTFLENASFRDTQVSGLADFSAAFFKKEVNFARSKFGGSVFFSTTRSRKGTLTVSKFGGGLKMFRCQIAGDLQLEGSEHEELAELESVQVKGNLLCRTAKFPKIDSLNPALHADIKFKKGLRLFGAVVDGAADFSQLESKGTANFSYMKVMGPTVFRTSNDSTPGTSTTLQDANFSGAVMAGGADFEGVHFERVASLAETRIGGSCRFSRVKFDDKADFRRCEVQGDAYFDRDVEFDRVSFEGARFSKQCLFNGATFPKGVDFSRGRVEGLLSFAGAEVSEKLLLEDSTAGAVVLDLNQAQLKPSELNLRGFTYSKITAPWQDLFHLMPDDPKGKSHLQPYAQLEKYFRSAGYERDADEVYLTRRKREWKLLWDGVLLRRSGNGKSWFGTLLRFLEDSVLRIIFNYGVPSYRLIGFALVLFVVGVLILSSPGGVKLRSDVAFRPTPETASQRAAAATGAFFASVVPGERSKIFTYWEPSWNKIYRNRGGPSFAQCASALGLLIYVCLVTSVASLAGLIKRKQS